MKNRIQLPEKITLADFSLGVISLAVKRLSDHFSLSQHAGRNQQRIGSEFSHLSDELKWDQFGNLMDECK